MVEPADLWEGDHLAQLGRRDSSRLRAVVVEQLVCSGLVAVGDVFAKNAPEMLLVQDDDVVETLSTYGADQAFDVGVLPR